MEFRYRAGESPDPSFFSSSSSSTNGYFASQALRAGLDLGRDGLLPAISPREALLRELQKERMREELLAREIARKRIAEEEVRREMELERRMAMRRIQEERLLSRGEGLRYFGPGIEPVVMPFEREVMVGERLNPGFARHFLETRMDDRVSVSQIHPGQSELRMRRTPLSSQGKVKLLVQKLSGTKRKAPGELPRPTRKEWSCSLCKVSTTGQEALNEHFQGKKHKMKEAFACVDSKTSKINDTTLVAKEKGTDSRMSKKINDATAVAKGKDDDDKRNEKFHPTASEAKGNKGDMPNLATDACVDKPVKQNSIERRKLQGKKPRTFLCKLCKVKCNSSAMLADHFNGKRHKALLEMSGKGDEDGTCTSSAAEVLKEVTDQPTNGKDEEKEDYAEKVNSIEAATNHCS